MKTKRAHRVIVTLMSPLLIAGFLGLVAASPASAAVSAGQIHGLNWGDTRDNFVCGNLMPTGLYDTESYGTVHSKSTAILGGLVSSSGANTVRMPVNIDTVAGSWWNAYTGAIDAATALGLNVILSEWDGCNSRDGQFDPGWQGMWDKVVAKYSSNDRILFEPMNEPFGYSTSGWLNAVAGWIGRYPALPKGRIIVSGPGYNHEAYSAGRDSRFNGTLLSVHNYAFWQGAQSYQAWKDQTDQLVAEFAGRTVFTEFGTFMTTGLNFNDTGSSTNEIAYLRGLTDEFNRLGVGSVYWPGLRGGDSYSLTTVSGATQNGSASSISVRLNNQSGLDRIRNGWRLGGSTGGGSSFALRGAGSNRCLDITGAGQTNGTLAEIWDCHVGANQTFTSTSAGELRVYSSTKCLDVANGGTANGAAVEIWDCNGGSNQQFRLNSDGTITAVGANKCLDVTGSGTANGTKVDIWTCSGGANQKWVKV
jgi:hypothetical protein